MLSIQWAFIVNEKRVRLKLYHCSNSQEKVVCFCPQANCGQVAVYRKHTETNWRSRSFETETVPFSGIISPFASSCLRDCIVRKYQMEMELLSQHWMGTLFIIIRWEDIFYPPPFFFVTLSLLPLKGFILSLLLLPSLFFFYPLSSSFTLSSSFLLSSLYWICLLTLVWLAPWISNETA